MEGSGVIARPQRKKRFSRFRGVIRKPSGKYGAQIIIPRKNRRMWLGTFATEEEAGLAYDGAARKLGFSERRCNFPNFEKPEPESSSQGGESAEQITCEAELPFPFDLNHPPPLV